MKVRKIFAIATATLVFIACGNALAQDTGGSAQPTPQGQSRSDVRKANHSLSNRVERALSKGGVQTTNVNVLAKGGAVVLTGSVADQSQIDTASRVAQNVQDVTSVSNRLTIRAGGQ
ncbi:MULTISPECIES: BON domain-containing protein [Caballeronia]|uniref:BON domain-containing protein n=1 Tax=Caballeronia jiangsuensis TaxID=1458357 RepID=A0ABW9CFK3_9BURK|nr:BON domain-containing protein [Caballeronia sp. GaOx3]